MIIEAIINIKDDCDKKYEITLQERGHGKKIYEDQMRKESVIRQLEEKIKQPEYKQDQYVIGFNNAIMEAIEVCQREGVK